LRHLDALLVGPFFDLAVAPRLEDRVGDVLRVESEILEVRPSQSNPGRGIVRVRNTTVNQDGQPVMIQTASLIVPRRPASGADSSPS